MVDETPPSSSTENAEESRLVCFCHHVRANEIRAAIRAGARTLEAVQDETQASTGCGGCEYDVREILDEELVLAEKSAQSSKESVG